MGYGFQVTDALGGIIADTEAKNYFLHSTGTATTSGSVYGSAFINEVNIQLPTRDSLLFINTTTPMFTLRVNSSAVMTLCASRVGFEGASNPPHTFAYKIYSLANLFSRTEDYGIELRDAFGELTFASYARPLSMRYATTFTRTSASVSISTGVDTPYWLISPFTPSFTPAGVSPSWYAYKSWASGQTVYCGHEGFFGLIGGVVVSAIPDPHNDLSVPLLVV